MKEILLIGDSIRMFCQKRLTGLLGDEYHVSAPGENCRFAAYTRNSLRFWLEAFPKPEIIHWNNGLWDIARLYGEDECFTPLDEYINNLRRTLPILKATGAKIIFATTTPTDPRREKPLPGIPSCHLNSDIERYNSAAVGLMKENGVMINDLYSVVSPHIAEYISEDLIHPNAAGIEAIASATAEIITDMFDNPPELANEVGLSNMSMKP